MPGHRQQAQDEILKYVQEIAGEPNRRLYEKKFASLSDEEFEKLIEGIEAGTAFLPVVSPNFNKDTQLQIRKNLQIGEKLGVRFFQRVKIPAKGDIPSYMTPIPYLIMHLPVRRQAQLVEKKISIPEHNNSVDNMTGQPAGASAGAKISYSEVQVLQALGLTQTSLEFLKYRGGDERGFAAMNTMIDRTGGVSLKAIEKYASGVKSTKTLKSYLAGMQLKAVGLS